MNCLEGWKFHPQRMTYLLLKSSIDLQFSLHLVKPLRALAKQGHQTEGLATKGQCLL